MRPDASRIALGCEQLGGADWGPIDVEAAMAAVRYAWDHGVRCFDTADVYGLGLSETRLAEALGGARHQAQIISKFGVRWSSPRSERAQTWRDASPEYLVEALEASLRRMGLERIPIYLVHWPDESTPLDETLGALEEQQRAGKIGQFGVSNHYGRQLAQARHRGASVTELPLSLVDQGAVEDIASAGAAGMDVVAYGVLAQGLLTGRYHEASTFPESDRRHRLPQFTAQSWQKNAALLERMSVLAGRHECSVPQVALQWVMCNPFVSTVVVGARGPSQVADALAVLDRDIPIEELSILPTG